MPWTVHTMHLTRAAFAGLVAVSTQVIEVLGGPIEGRVDSTSWATSTVPTAVLVGTTASGKSTTIEVAWPIATHSGHATTSSVRKASTASQASTASTVSSASTALSASTASSASQASSATSSSLTPSLTPSHDFPVCRDATAKPFCLPANNTEVYYGDTYYVTWNSNYFPYNSSITIFLNWFNDTKKQVWSSGRLDNRLGATAVAMKEDWLQGYTAYNLTFLAQEYDSAADTTATYYNGPTVQLKVKSPQHYQPPPTTKVPNELGLKVGLPVCLCLVAFVIAGLFFVMRKQRRIGIGNVMGRNRGYGTRKSRRQRLGLGRSGKDDILLQEREVSGLPQYRDHPPPANSPLSDVGLGSPAESPTEEGRNAFREEMERQKTSGRM